MVLDVVFAAETVVAASVGDAEGAVSHNHVEYVAGY